VSAAFDAVFGVFVASMLAIAFMAVRWGHRRDRAARAGVAPRGLARRRAIPPPDDPPPAGGTGRDRTPDATGGAAS
jgi:hypothetical protein